MTDVTPDTTAETPDDSASARNGWQARYDASRVREADFTTFSGAEVV